jgi:Carboxypeptidase regulatory-like domain
MRLRVAGAGLALLLACITPRARAQAVASVRGNVTDATGAAVPAAQVHIANAATNSSRDTVTNNERSYEFVQLAPGTYTLTVSANGYTAAERRDLKLQVNLPATADFRPACHAGCVTARVLGLGQS